MDSFQSFFKKFRWADVVVHGIALLMLASVTIPLLQGLFGVSAATGRGGPFGHLLHSSGETSERLLIATLLCTPLAIVFGWHAPGRYRKWLGIYAFFALVVHVVAQIANKGFTVNAWLGNIGLAIGTVATVIMLVLWVTSNNTAMRLLGRGWKKVHYTTYAAAILTELHVLLVEVPRLNMHGILFGAVILVLLAFRLPPVKTFFAQRRLAKTPALAA